MKLRENKITLHLKWAEIGEIGRRSVGKCKETIERAKAQHIQGPVEGNWPLPVMKVTEEILRREYGNIHI